MDVECEPGCSFSTGSYSDSVRELAGEPGQHPNKLTMASFDDAASLLLLELDLAWADAGPWSYLLLTHVARFFFAAAHWRRQQRRPAVWWRHRATQVRGLVSRIALLLFDVDLAELVMRAQSNPYVLLHCFSKLLPFRAQRGGRLRWGCSAGGPSCLAPLPFFYISEAWLGRCSWS